MIKVKLKDAEGHGYWLYEDGQFVVALKTKPSVGIQFKTMGWLKKGVLSFHDLPWNERDSCWYIPRFPLLKTKTFKIDILFIERAYDAESKPLEGWVHPRVLTTRGKTAHPTGFEVRLRVLPKDLKRTRELAAEAWEKER